jgi:hypothetical protein
MAEVVYVPVTQDMTEERLLEFQRHLDQSATDHNWNGCFVVMRCRPAKSWCCGADLAPATRAKEAG